jgi:hypothetical protein
MESSTLPNDTVISATSDIVAVASHVDNDHKSVEVVENGVKVSRCTIYPNLSCDDHVRTSAVGMKYIKGRFAAPVSIWCDPLGKEFGRKSGFRQPDAFLADIKEALDKVPGKRVAKADYDRQAVPLEDAENALSQGKYKQAIEGFTAALKGEIEPLRKSAETGLAGVKRTGEGMLVRGRTAVESGRKEQGKELLAHIASEFGALECGKQAAELLKKLGDEKK